MPSDAGNSAADGAPCGAPVATQATPSGRGSIATVLLAGVDILPRLEPLFRAAADRPLTPSHTVYFGHWNHLAATDESSNHWEEVVVTVSEKNGTSGTETTIEIQCHGGDRASRSILNSLRARGFEVVLWTEWLRRHSSIFAQEIAAALAAAPTQRTALLLLAQGAGGNGVLRREIDEILGIIANPNGHARAVDRIKRLIRMASVGCHLVEPWQVAVVGAPNVGKSSLVNALVGYQRAIVYDQPGTTRDELATLTALDGWPIRLWDTAGLRHTTDEVERLGISRTAARLTEAELLIHVYDARFADQPIVLAEDAGLQNQIKQHPNVLCVRNKIDLVRNPATPSANAIATSALTGEGLQILKESIIAALIPTPPHHDTPLLFTHRQTELARKALSALEQNDTHVACLALNSILR